MLTLFISILMLTAIFFPLFIAVHGNFIWFVILLFFSLIILLFFMTFTHRKDKWIEEIKQPIVIAICILSTYAGLVAHVWLFFIVVICTAKLWEKAHVSFIYVFLQAMHIVLMRDFRNYFAMTLLFCSMCIFVPIICFFIIRIFFSNSFYF